MKSSSNTSTIKKAFKYRIYPDQAQQADLAIQFGHARFVYNWGLNRRKAYYAETGKGLAYYDLKKEVTALKREPETEWLKQADSQVLQSKIKDLDRAYTNFFAGRAEYPSFKAKHDRQSIRYPQRFKVNGRSIYLPKVGWVRAVFHRPLEGVMKNCTVSKTKTGEYYVSIQCEVETELPPLQGEAVGVDLGLVHFATLSKPLNGQIKFDHPKHLRKSEKKLKRLGRQLSRKKKGSQNREKARLRLARQHQKVARQRADFLHKLSYNLVTEFGFAGLETLNLKGMLKNHNLAKAIADSGWGEFGRMCDYKGPWYGAEVERRDRFFASSKICHGCGFKNTELELHHRFWLCPKCHTFHDRDENASLNLELGPGLVRSNACGEAVRPADALPEAGGLAEAGSRTASSVR